MILRTCILVFALASPACAADSDGDTVRVLDDKKKEIKVRLSGIDAPEFGQAFGTKSKEDDHGRTLGTLNLMGTTPTVKWSKLGVWADRDPVPPWKYRRSNR